MEPNLEIAINLLILVALALPAYMIFFQFLFHVAKRGQLNEPLQKRFFNSLKLLLLAGIVDMMYIFTEITHYKLLSPAIFLTIVLLLLSLSFSFFASLMGD